MRRISSIGLALALLAPVGLNAQDATITGTVRSQTLGPVRGAFVAIPDLEASTATNDQGAYLLVIPAERVRGQQVTMVVSNIGYENQEVTITLSAGVHRQDITLQERAITLDEVVVTGTAGRLERRAQAAVVASVDAGEIAEVAPVTNVANVLQSRVPGVSLQLASGTSGAAQTIRIRGAASISLSNEPLIFIDGVRADGGTSGSGGVGGQQTSRLNDLRPENIASIEIVKGPAAATLYGADASAGVIQIITKRGQVGGGFHQALSVEYNAIDQNFTPPANFAVCGQGDIDDGVPICQGKSAGDIVSDNPLVRYDSFRTGQKRSILWSGRGGGDNYNFFFSLGGDDEDGTTLNNEYGRYNGRLNFDFIPSQKLRIEAGFGLARVTTRLPNNDNNIYGWLGGGLLGDPTLVGGPTDGWYGVNRQNDAIKSINTTERVIRVLPRVALHYTPFEWFTNRLTLGADMTRTEFGQLFPKNSNTWYDAADLNSGDVFESRELQDRITIDYLGNISNQLTDWLSSDLSFGLQYTSRWTDQTNAEGIGLVTNAARSVNAAAISQGGQSRGEQRQIGFLGQWMGGFHDRFFLTLGARVDRSSAFARDADVFFSPKVGASYVLSDDPAIRDVLPEFVNALRVRAAWGTTGRSPNSGVVATYDPTPYLIPNGEIGNGVIPDDPGNTKLKPERGIEYEAGFEAGLLDNRLGLTVTYFHKISKDLILDKPIPPSLGFDEDSLVNIGEVVNNGIEVAANAQLVTTRNFGWEANVALNTLHNEITDMGEIEPFGSLNRVEEGMQIGAFVTRRILGFEQYKPNPEEFPDSMALRAVVSDEPEFFGNLLPTFEGSFSSTMNFFGNLQLYAQLDWKQDFYIYNNTTQFRERQWGTGERWVRRYEILSDEERVRRFGPFVDSEGNNVNQGAVNVAYIEPGDFLRLREVTLTYTLPQNWASAFGADGASIVVGGRNLGLWTKYSGFDPEVNSSTGSRSRSDFLTLPPARRWIARVNLQF
ncbi:MAG TPA: SusC/RagA family TonB-linked outer membrane protein [Longimicrobiales bacterium]